MSDPLVTRAPWIVLLVAVLATGAAVWGTTRIEPEVDFVDTVPDHAGLEPYRHLLDRLDGVRFVAVYAAHDNAFGPDLRSDEGFAALVEEQGAFTQELLDAFPNGTFSHQLSVHEAMAQGNYMLEKIATAGNPRPESYAVPDDDVRFGLVRDQILGDGSVDDILASDGRSAIMLFFFATNDNTEARHLTVEVADFLADWARDRAHHPATKDHAPSGLLWASAYTDQVNQDGMQRLAPWATAAVAVALLWVVRRPVNVLIATASLGAALLWLYGIMGWADIKISFLTLFLAPIVVGIGIDHAVHVLHRYEEERDQDMPRAAALATAVRHTGAAVSIAAATTALGLAVLLFVPNPLFAQIGGVGALGVVLGFVAAVTLTPALRAVLPDGHRRSRPDRTGPRIASIARGMRRFPLVPIVATLLLVGGATWIAATQTTIESGSSENEFPQDDPVITLQHRIEDEYGAFQRAYLIVEGDLTDPATLQAMHDAVARAALLPLFRSATAVTDLLLADAATDDGAVDILEGMLTGMTGTTPSDKERLPQSPEEARERLDALFDDPLWRTIAPFTITRDYSLAVVAITIEPWADQEALRTLRDALEAQAHRLQDDVPPSQHVAAAGAPVNRAAIIDQTPTNLAIAVGGATAVVLLVVALTNLRRGLEAWTVAGVGGLVVLASAACLLASIPVLDGLYAWAHAKGWGAANTATLSDMFLLAFAVTVSVGIDDLVHLSRRYWEERDRGLAPAAARDAAFQHAGRAITGTSLTTFVAFVAVTGVYFLQSKNLAILIALGVVYAYVFTLLLAPLALGRKGEARAED